MRPLTALAARPPCRARPPIRRPARRLGLERLEDRTAPALITWDGGPAGNGTDWLDPANWNYRDPQGQDHDALPGPGDNVTVGGTGTNPVILLNGNAAVHSASSSR